MAKAKAKETVHEVRLMHRPHRTGLLRVWNTRWPGDLFEIISKGDFEQIQRMCARFDIPLVEAEDD